MINRYLVRVRKLLGLFVVRLWRQSFMRHGVAAGVEHVSVLRQLGDVRTVFDIGANRGQFALVARYCFPAAMIVSFEPLREPSKIYRVIFAKDKKSILHQVAIGPEVGNFTIHVSQRDDSSSLLPISKTQNAIFPGTAESHVEQIEVGRLSSYVDQDFVSGEALLKLDVQGFELQALVGCQDQLDRFTWVYAECSFVELYRGQAFASEVIAWLRERGFDLMGVYNVAYHNERTAVQADFLFRRKKSPYK